MDAHIRTRWLALAVVVLAVLIGGLAVAGNDALRAALPQRPSAAQGTVIVPDHFLRTWDPVTVFFDRDAGPAAGGPEDQPARFASITPAQPGAWTWVNGRTLQFQPADPWPPLSRVQVRAG